VNPAYVYTPTLWLPLGAAVLVAALGLYGWRHRAARGAKPFAALSLFAGLWLVGIALGGSAVAPATKIAWWKFQGAWQIPAATAGACFALECLSRERWLTRRRLGLLALPALLFLGLMVTSDAQLIWRRLEVGADGSVAPAYALPGAILVAYGLSLALISAAAFLWLSIRSPQQRWPAALMLGGQIAGCGGTLLSVARLPALTPPAPVITAILVPWATYAIALFGLRIFDPLPAARTAALAQMREGMVICDARWRVLSLNRAAEAILGAAAAGARERDVREFLAAFSGLPALEAESEAERSEISRGEGAAARHYTLDQQALRDSRGLVSGHLLLLREVSERKQAEGVLGEAEEIQRLIFQNASDGIAIYEERPDRGERRIIECNERYAEMSGRSKKELLEMGDTALAQKPLPPVPYARPRREIDQAQSVGLFSWVRPDGTENIIEYSAVSLRVGGRLLTIGLDRDVTEQKQLQEQLLEQQRVVARMQERELQMARQVQASLLPEHTPEVPGWGMAAFWRPARVVAGDFYDLFPVRLAAGAGGAQGWGVVIADVSDKGMPAALFMALTRSTVRSSVAQGQSPRESLARANALICADATSGMFVSLFYAQLDPHTGEMTAVNCGHNPPLLLRAGEGEFVELTRTGMVLGIEETAPYAERRDQLGPGDLLVLYTDGLTEALNAQGEEYGLPRVQRLILEQRTAPAAELAAELERAVTDWAGGEAPVALYDDVTVVVIKRL
jgi:PAS domain S-box-containing protein